MLKRRLKEPFGKAGLTVAVFALVFAMVGGAFAAASLTGNQKKEVKKIAKEFAGKDGAQGPPGAQGPKGDAGAGGAKGADGKDGNNGTPGKDGKVGESVNIFKLDPGNGEACDETGGAKFANGTGVAFACNGEGGGGGGGYPETLPAGRTMTGYWEVLGDAALHVKFVESEEWALTTISFPLPLAAAATETFLISVAGNSEEEKNKCPGGPDAPKATPGVLCLYQSLGVPVTLKLGGPTTFGAGLFFAETDKGFGSWAVMPPSGP